MKSGKRNGFVVAFLCMALMLSVMPYSVSAASDTSSVAKIYSWGFTEGQWQENDTVGEFDMLATILYVTYNIERQIYAGNPHNPEPQEFIDYAVKKDILDSGKIILDETSAIATKMDFVELLSRTKKNLFSKELDTSITPQFSDFSALSEKQQRYLTDLISSGLIKNSTNSFNPDEELTAKFFCDALVSCIEKYELLLKRGGRNSGEHLLKNQSQMPSNASDYPFILKDVPKEVYEYPFTFSPYGYFKGSTPAECYGWIKGEYFNVMDKIETVGDIILNIDYRTITVDYLRPVNKFLERTFSDKELEEYVSFIKNNHIQIKGSLHPYIGTMWCYGYNDYFIRLKVEFTVLNGDADNGLILGYNDVIFKEKNYNFYSNQCMVYDTEKEGFYLDHISFWPLLSDKNAENMICIPASESVDGTMCINDLPEIEVVDIPATLMGKEVSTIWITMPVYSGIKKIIYPKTLRKSSIINHSISDDTVIEIDPENPYMKITDGVIFSKDGKELLLFVDGMKTNVTGYIVPNGVETISWCAFDECSFLTEIVVPESVTNIESLALGSIALKRIVIPASVTNISSDAFANCSSKPVIYGYEGSYAQTFAQDYDFQFVVLKGDFIKGDINGDNKVTLSDALKVLNAASGKLNLTEQEAMAADVTWDGKVTKEDAVKLLDYVSGKIVSL